MQKSGKKWHNNLVGSKFIWNILGSGSEFSKPDLKRDRSRNTAVYLYYMCNIQALYNVIQCHKIYSVDCTIYHCTISRLYNIYIIQYIYMIHMSNLTLYTVVLNIHPLHIHMTAVQ